MATKMAIHVGSFKKGSIVGIEKHNLRKNEKYENENIDVTRSHENMILKKPIISIYADTKKLVEQIKENGGRIRSDSNWISEIIVYAPTGMIDINQRIYFEQVFKKLSAMVGEKNVRACSVHLDETTPHLHFDFTPIVWKDEKPVALSSKKIITRKFLFSLHDELPAHLQPYGFDVVRGDKISEIQNAAERKKRKTLSGRTINQYKSEADAERIQITNDLNRLHEEKRKVQEELQKLHEEKNQLQVFVDRVETALNDLYGTIGKIKQYANGISFEPLKKANMMADRAKENLYGIKAKIRENDIFENEKRSWNSVLDDVNRRKTAANENQDKKPILKKNIWDR